MAGRSTPAAEVEIDDALVRALLRDQMPDLASLPLARAASGWDNVLYRLGGELCVRLPRRLLGARLVEHEQRWLPQLAERLPLPVPVPVRTGRPACGYPWSWSVCPWFPGRPATECAPDDLAAAARALGTFVARLHVAAPPEAPHNPLRGIALRERNEVLRALVPVLAEVDPALDLDGITDAWVDAIDEPLWAGPRTWVHGDLHPGNVLVHEGRVAAVVDFGDLCGGDPATDIAIGWLLFDAPERAVFRDAVGAVDDGTWRRGRGWALLFGAFLLAHSADNGAFGRVGSDTLRRVLDDARPG